MSIIKNGTRVIKFGSNVFSSQIDPDALAFVNFLNLTGTTLASSIVSAVDNLVKSLKSIQDTGQSTTLWERCRAIYPFVGGNNAYKNKINLKDPRNLDVAYRLVQVGAGTISYTGSCITVSATGSACFDTKLIPSSGFTSPNAFAGAGFISLKINRQTNNMSVGCNTSSIANGSFYFRPRLTSDVMTFRCYSGGQAATPSTDSTGRWIFTRPSFKRYLVFRNGSMYNETLGTNAGSKPNFSIYVGGRNDMGTATYEGKQRYGIAGFCEYITENEAILLDNAIEVFETAVNKI